MRRTSHALAALLASTAALSACNRPNTASNVAAPGEPKSAQTAALEVGATLLQNREPLKVLDMYLDGFHFMSGAMGEQMEAHHYCGKLNEELIQCVIFDGNQKDAKLMGVEYIVSERLFETLPADERPLWHSHRYEVKSGALIAPGIPEAAEHALMKQLVSTYGKTWHTWHTHKKDALPLGLPHSMMGFTKDGQLRPELQSERDRRFDVSTEKERAGRADLPEPPIAEGADAWEKDPGQAVLLHRAAADRAPTKK
ncbi:MAG: OBAP family protein [Polyangia bacterium]